MAVIQWLQGVFESKKDRSDDSRFYKKIDEELVFAKSKPLTLGVECELGLVDKQTLLPAHVGLDIIAELKSQQIKEESYMHVVELTSVVGKDVHETEAQMKAELNRLMAAAEQRGLMITGTGCPPSIFRKDMKQVQNKRYDRLHDERKILHHRFCTLGMHVHIGMENADQCIRFHNFFMHFVPHLIALSASSPFEEGVETGLASIRPTITESLPVAGMPYNFRSWQEYVTLCRAMYKAKTIDKLKDMWMDIRSCPTYGTLEIRICDQPATFAEVMAITAFIHGLALWFQDDQAWLDDMPRPNAWRMRDNKWRAMRYGLKADLIVNNQGETRPIVDDIKLWLGRIQPYIEYNDYRGYIHILEKMMERGNSSDRQRKVFEASKSLDAVARFNCEEFAARTPLWDKAEQYQLVDKETSPVLAKSA